MTTKQLTSTRFGSLDIEEEAIISFDRGLLGLEDSTTSMVLIQFENSPYFWLHSTIDPDLALIVTDPWEFWPDYDLVVPDDVQRDLALAHPEEAEIMVIVSIRSAPEPDGTPTVSANLLGPLVVNSTTRQGRQLVLENREYSTQTRMES